MVNNRKPLGFTLLPVTYFCDLAGAASRYGRCGCTGVQMGRFRGWKLIASLAGLAVPGAAWSAYQLGFDPSDNGLTSIVDLARHSLIGASEPGSWMTVVGGALLILSGMRRRSNLVTYRQAV